MEGDVKGARGLWARGGCGPAHLQAGLLVPGSSNTETVIQINQTETFVPVTAALPPSQSDREPKDSQQLRSSVS